MNKVKYYRLISGLLLKDLSEKTGLSVGHLSHIENGNKQPSILSGMQTVDLASGGTQATNSILAGLNTGGVQLTTTATTLGTETATNLNNSLLTGGAGLQATASQLGTDTINSLSTSFNNGASTLDLSALQLGTNTTSSL